MSIQTLIYLTTWQLKYRRTLLYLSQLNVFNLFIFRNPIIYYTSSCRWWWRYILCSYRRLRYVTCPYNCQKECRRKFRFWRKKIWRMTWNTSMVDWFLKIDKTVCNWWLQPSFDIRRFLFCTVQFYFVQFCSVQFCSVLCCAVFLIMKDSWWDFLRNISKEYNVSMEFLWNIFWESHFWTFFGECVVGMCLRSVETFLRNVP